MVTESDLYHSFSTRVNQHKLKKSVMDHSLINTKVYSLANCWYTLRLSLSSYKYMLYSLLTYATDAVIYV